ncbi:hypothetical protein ERJ75_000314700 [Trypanosoma vivax]|nr:hypothetical protein ERJ75_000314700 [Trypanosoma vivax]
MGWCDGESLAFWHGAVPAGVGSVCTLGLSLRARLLGTLAAQAEREVDVLGLDRHATAVDARAVRVREQRHNDDSVASCAARIALLWKRRPSFCAPDTSRTRRWKGAFCSSRSVERWNWRISRSATVPGLQRRCACFTPEPASDVLGAFLLFFDVTVFFVRAVSLVRDMVLCLA